MGIVDFCLGERGVGHMILDALQIIGKTVL